MARLKRMIELGMNDGLIAAELERTKASVKARRSKLRRPGASKGPRKPHRKRSASFFLS
jgi:hypothetical protein